ARGKSIRMVSTFSVFTPSLMFPAYTMLRIISPAPTNRTTERATSTPTKIFVNKRRLTPMLVPWPPSFNALLRSILDIRKAGASQKNVHCPKRHRPKEKNHFPPNKKPAQPASFPIPLRPEARREAPPPKIGKKAPTPPRHNRQ